MPPAVYKDLCLDVYAGSVRELLDLGATVVEEFPRWTGSSALPGTVRTCAQEACQVCLVLCGADA